MYVSLKSNIRDLQQNTDQLESTSSLFRCSIYVYAYRERCSSETQATIWKIPRSRQGFENKLMQTHVTRITLLMFSSIHMAI